MSAFQTETSAPSRVAVLQLDTQTHPLPSQNIWVSSGASSTFAAQAAKLSAGEDDVSRHLNLSDNVNVKVIQQKTAPADRNQVLSMPP